MSDTSTVEPTPALPDVEPIVGYRAMTAATAVGISYRQLDYWARTALVEPSLAAGAGSGTQRLYAWRDVLELRLVKRLLDAGVTLQRIRTALEVLAKLGELELSSATLITDGVTVYLISSPGEIVDLLAGGQVVMGIGLGPLVDEVTDTLAPLDAIDLNTLRPVSQAVPDELAARRSARVA